MRIRGLFRFVNNVVTFIETKLIAVFNRYQLKVEMWMWPDLQQSGLIKLTI